MNARRTRSRIWRRCSTFAAGAALVGYFAVPLANAQNAGGNAEHWVGTWATAVVARAQGPQAGPPAGFGPPPAQNPSRAAAATRCAGPEPRSCRAGPGTSRRGSWPGRRWSRVRSALEHQQPDAPPNRAHEHRWRAGSRCLQQCVRNSAAAHSVGAHRSPRKRRLDRCEVRPRVDVCRQRIRRNSRRRDPGQRSRNPLRAGVRRSRDRSLPARRHWIVDLAGDDAQRGAADQLRVTRGRAHGHRGHADRDDDTSVVLPRAC